MIDSSIVKGRRLEVRLQHMGGEDGRWEARMGYDERLELETGFKGNIYPITERIFLMCTPTVNEDTGNCS